MEIIIENKEYKRLKKIEKNYLSKRTILETDIHHGVYCIFLSKTIYTEDEATKVLIQRIQELNLELSMEKSKKWYNKIFN